MRKLMWLSALALAACSQSDTHKQASADASSGSKQYSQPELPPVFAQAIQDGYKVIACVGKTALNTHWDGISASPTDNPDQNGVHDHVMVIRVKADATPPFDMFGTDSNNWMGVCNTNCSFIGGNHQFTVTKEENEGTPNVPGETEGKTTFDYDGKTMHYHVAVAQTKETGIQHLDEDFTGQCMPMQNAFGSRS